MTAAHESPPSPYVPVAGEVVVVEEILSCDSGKPYFEQLVGRAVKVTDVRPPEGPWSMLIWIEGATEWMYCRVRPLRSAIDVECPGCQRKPGDPCRDMVFGCDYRPEEGSHSRREALFLELTKDSAYGTAGAGQDRGATKASPADAAPLGVEMGTAASADAVGTGRAAGDGSSNRGQPAAPSGFRAPRTVWEVPCEACGAPARLGDNAVELRDAACHDDHYAILWQPHALRVRAFEARRERKEERPVKVPPRLPIPIMAADKRSALQADYVERRIVPTPPPHPWSDEANWYWSGT